MPDKMDLEPSPYGDFVLPFDIAKAGVRGRLVRLDAASARALGAHVLPEPAARVAGEMVALGALLGTALKLDGRLTIQTKGDGPLDLVTADYYGADENRHHRRDEPRAHHRPSPSVPPTCHRVEVPWLRL